MGFFKRWKKKKKLDKLIEEYSVEGGELEQKHNVEHQALGFCEQLIASSKDLEETKKEYRLVTDYLNDIQKIETMPEDEIAKIRDTAQNILGLNQAREEYTHKKKRLSDAQFMQMEQLKDEVPDDIRRLSTNENYQSMVRRDMEHLEGEKSEWNYYMESIIREQKFLKVGMFALVAVFLIGIGVLGYIHYCLYRDMLLFLLGFLLLVAVGGSCGFLRMQNNVRELKRANQCINRAVAISNQMKAKYVTVTNAVDYACEKFHVRNSMELTYLWEQYMEAKREQETAEKNSEDLEYFSKKLVRDLKRHQLYDAAIWVHQANAIVDKKEMVEVKHYLLVRRQKLRSRIEQQIADLQSSKAKILTLLKDNQEYKTEIMEVLKSIDQMCGA